MRLLAEKYGETEQNITPTRSKATLNQWSSKFEWVNRAATYDAEIERQKNDRARDIMQSGLALEHERAEKLKALAAFLEGQLYERGEDGVYHNVWLPDVKQIGSGQYAERVDIERFNAALLSEYRATLDDIAKETGGRKQNINTRSMNVDVANLTDEQLERIANGEDPFSVLGSASAS